MIALRLPKQVHNQKLVIIFMKNAMAFYRNNIIPVRQKQSLHYLYSNNNKMEKYTHRRSFPTTIVVLPHVVLLIVVSLLVGNLCWPIVVHCQQEVSATVDVVTLSVDGIQQHHVQEVHNQHHNNDDKLQQRMIRTGTLRPSDLPEPIVFTDWDTISTTIRSTNNDNKVMEHSQQTIRTNRTVAIIRPKRTTNRISINTSGGGGSGGDNSNTTSRIIQIEYATGSVQQTFREDTMKDLTNHPTNTTTTAALSSHHNDNKETNPSSSSSTATTTTTNTANVNFFVLNSIVTKEEVHEIVQLLKQYNKKIDDDPDTVDGMPSYEIFIDRPDMNRKGVPNTDNDQLHIAMSKQVPQPPSTNDDTNEQIQQPPLPTKARDYYDKNERSILRQKLQQILLPIINERITPFIEWKYPELCSSNRSSKTKTKTTTTKTQQKTKKRCVACYSLIRRYRYGERVSHAPHHDGHALVTAVTSLSDYNRHYRGGLYVVSPNYNTPTYHNYSNNTNSELLFSSSSVNNYNEDYYNHHKTNVDSITNKTMPTVRYLGLNAGDTAIHTSALLHGVKVYNKMKQPKTTERWSWILWYRDVYVDVDDDDDDNDDKVIVLEEGMDPIEDAMTNTTTRTASDTTITSNSSISATILHKSNDNSCSTTIIDTKKNNSMLCSSPDHSLEWFYNCAIQGNGICQMLHSTKVNEPYDVLFWNMKAAKNGVGIAAVKMGRAYLKQLPSPLLQYNEAIAMNYFQLSIQSNNNPEGHYAIAELLLLQWKNTLQQQQQLNNTTTATTSTNKMNKKQMMIDEQLLLQKVVYHLEEAAMAGHVYAMFNLGIAHTYGYGIYKNNKHVTSTNNRRQYQQQPIVDTKLASEWFVQSGLPEGYYTASFYYQSIGDIKKQTKCMKRAQLLGYGTFYRTEARQRSGSGGLTGIDLNLHWPIAHDGRVPPSF